MKHFPIPYLLSRASVIPVVGPGIINSSAAFARPQPSNARSMALDVDGITWREYLAGVPRYAGAAQALVMEQQRTNLVRNPRCEGGTVGTIGSGGVMPTNWSVNVFAGLAFDLVSVGTENGLPFVELRIYGTPASTNSVQVNHDTFSASTGTESYAYSLFSRFSAGSLTNVGDAVVAAQVGANVANTSYTLTSGALGGTRQSAVVASPAPASAVVARWRLGVTSGLPIDVTVRLGAVQVEVGAFATTPMLPAVGTPAAATRNQETLSIPLSAQGISQSGVGTYFGVAAINQSGVGNQILLSVDDNSATNSYEVNINTTAQAVLTRRNAGAALSTGVAGTVTPGTPFRWAISIDGTGRAAISINGGVTLSVTGGAVAGLLSTRTALLGNNVGRGNTLHLSQRSLPFALSDSALQALTASL